MGRLLKDNSGFALILTILVVSLIVAVTLQFNTSMRSDLQAATNLRDGIRLAFIAKSGFNSALALLYEDAFAGNADTLRDNWAHLESLSTSSASLFDEGRFEVRIMDHSGRIAVNQLVDQSGKYTQKQKELLTRFLSSAQFGLDSEEVSNLIDAIKDWIDADNEVTGFGAEDSYYKEMGKPYSCKNGPLEFLEELLLVRGVTKELFYGTKEKPGISNYLTIHGDGRININTADPLVLRSLSDQLDQEMVTEMVGYREDEKNDLNDSGWYQKVPGMSHVNIDPDLVTTLSTYFEITSKGLKEAVSKRVKGMVERKEGKVRILSWKLG